MREGIDTPFDVDLRWKTVDAISNSPLRWLTCIEPLGIEHTNEEIADRILENLAHHPYAMSVMARVNVPGTPFEGMEPISEERMLHLLATLRLCVGTKVHSCGMHPATPAALYAGGSNFTVSAVPIRVTLRSTRMCGGASPSRRPRCSSRRLASSAAPKTPTHAFPLTVSSGGRWATLPITSCPTRPKTPVPAAAAEDDPSCAAFSANLSAVETGWSLVYGPFRFLVYVAALPHVETTRVLHAHVTWR